MFLAALPIPVLIVIIVTSVVVTFLLVLIVLINRKKRAEDKVQKIRDAFNLYNSQLITSCYDMIKRIKSLSQYSRSYEMKYYENQKKYDELLNKKAAEIKEELDNLKPLLDSKNFKELKRSMSSCEKEITSFGNYVGVLNSDLQEILHDDRDAREACLVLKEKYRTIHEFYNTNINDLKPIEKPFNIIFARADKFFVNFDSLLDHAQFQEANHLLPNQEKVFDAVLNVMNDLPGLANLIFVVIPAKIDGIIEEVKQLVSEQYILDNLNIPKFIKNVRRVLETEAKKLEMLDTYEVNKNLMNIQDSLHDLELKLEAEKEAKQKFLSDQDTLSVSSYEIEKRYSRLVNSLPNYQKAYMLDKKKVDSLLILRNDIEAVGYLKRELDSYLDAGNKQPFSVINSRVSKMREEIEKVVETMKDYQDYLDKVKNDSETTYSKIRDLYLALKQTQYKLRISIGSKAINDIYLKRISVLFDNLKTIDTMLTSQPVDVYNATNLFNSINEKYNTIVKEVDEIEVKCKKAESSILYANAYRVDYFDSRPNLDRAEKAFIEGDFDRATSEAIKVLDMYKIK